MKSPGAVQDPEAPIERPTMIHTGTPEGVGMAADPPRWLKPGDQVAITIAGIGRLCNPVVAEGLPG
jgi:2-keto-4-pentenoate hydratase/2-oxohepta-3-ene-1,7-dioic acid hydratase in catechol pathway